MIESEVISVRGRGKDFWIEHLERAKDFKGTDSKYCRENGLDPRSFSRNKVRFGYSEIVFERKAISNSTFSKVILKDKKSQSLPDPRWLAEFLKAWGELS